MEQKPASSEDYEWFKKDRKILYKTIFPNTFHYIPINPQKTQKFYEFILVDTGSIELTHYRDSNTKQPVYSKIKIMKILSLQEWELPPYQSKSFSLKFEPQNYTYYDYQEAWNHILFLSPTPHSWFTWFRKGISLQFPKWFQAWFQNFGPIEAFFPKEASMAYEYFKSKSSFLQEYKFILFIAAMGISWIMTWEYDSAAYEECSSIQYLVRIIKIKWWNKYDINLLSKRAIDQWLTTSQKRPAITASSTTNEQIAYKKETQFLAQKRQIMAALAAATSEEDIQSSLQAIQTVPLGEDEE
ncbi:hypothetical protein S245_044468, partial [Arachis hypogaea]